jgi:HlyD family secretion protein
VSSREELRAGVESDVALVLADDERDRLRIRRRRIVWGGALAILAVVLLARVFGGDEETVRYVTEPATRGSLTVTVTATGTLEPTNKVDISSELSGIIRSVEVDFNDTVEVGQVLAQLDTTRLDAQVLQSKAALEAARARVAEEEAGEREAEAQLARLERVHELSGGKVPSAQELVAAEAGAARAAAASASARAVVTQAEATLDAQQTDLFKTAIRSPIRGVVLTRAAEPGQTVASSLQAPILFTLAEDLTRMELNVSVDEADVGQVASGQAASFTVDAWPDRAFSARVTQVRLGSETVEGVVTYETILEVDNTEGLLRPGMTATADVTVRKVENAVLVPNAALRFTPPRPQEDEASGGLLRALLPMRFAGRDRDRDKGDGRGQRIWVLRNGQAEEVRVHVDASDGAFTALVDPPIEPGTEVIIDTQQQSES